MLSFSLLAPKNISPLSPGNNIAFSKDTNYWHLVLIAAFSSRGTYSGLDSGGATWKKSTRRRFENSDLPKRGIDVDSGMQEYGATE